MGVYVYSLMFKDWSLYKQKVNLFMNFKNKVVVVVGNLQMDKKDYIYLIHLIQRILFDWECNYEL